MQTIYTDPHMQAYFDTLPASVQETLVQSGAQADTLQQLEALVLHLTQK